MVQLPHMSPLYFLWDYNLNEDAVRAILRGNNTTERAWLVARIITHARYEDIWKYLSISDIIENFPRLRLKPEVAKAWKHALTVWGYHV